MTQTGLDFNALPTPYQRSSDTSKAAAKKARDFVGKQGADVLAWMRSRGEFGGTQKECHTATGIERPSLCARFNALEGVHAILKTGDRRGCCVVYRTMYDVAVTDHREAPAVIR